MPLRAGSVSAGRLRLLSCLALVGATGCFAGVRPDETVLHVREPIAVVTPSDGDGRTAVVVAELDASDGAAPRAVVYRVDGGGRVRLDEMEGSAAEAIADEVRRGGSLRDAWCAAALSPPCGDLPEAAHRGAAVLGGELSGWRLRVRRADHSKWGEAWVAELEGEARTLELLRTVAEETSLFVVSADTALVLTSTRSVSGLLRTGDAIAIDLLAAGARLLAEAAADALDAGDDDRARGLVERAVALGAALPRLHFVRARLLARTGAGVDAVVDALRPAIASEPALYRMEARVSPDFAPLRAEEAFVSLTRPRALPGSNRAGRSPGPLPAQGAQPAPEPQAAPEPQPVPELSVPPPP